MELQQCMPCKLHSFYVPQHNDIMLIEKSALTYCKPIAFGNVFFLAALAIVFPSAKSSSLPKLHLQRLGVNN